MFSVLFIGFLRLSWFFCADVHYYGVVLRGVWAGGVRNVVIDHAATPTPLLLLQQPRTLRHIALLQLLLQFEPLELEPGDVEVGGGAAVEGVRIDCVLEIGSRPNGRVVVQRGVKRLVSLVLIHLLLVPIALVLLQF